jgi:hypothetical protein
MKRNLLPLYLLLLCGLLTTCSKNDSGSSTPPDTEEKCTAAEQTGIESLVARDTLDEITYGGNFKKTYGENGLVERLVLQVEATAKRRHNLDYKFTYEGNIAHVAREWKIYRPDHNEELQLVATDYWNYDVVFNTEGFATQSGDVTYEYSNGKLIAGADSENILNYSFEYDEHGSITKIKQFTSYGYRSLTYDYDYSKEAKHQLYLTSGNWINATDLNMLEVMGWVPLQPKHLRTMHWLKKYREEPNTDSTHAKYTFTDHVVSADGKLTSFRMTDGAQLSQTVSVGWHCDN